MDNIDNDEDLSMQIGWNQLFQQFVSDLFSDTEEKNCPVVTIDNLDKNGKAVGTVLPALRQAVDFVRTKYARRFSPAQLPETNHLSVLAEGLALYLNSALSRPQYEALSAQLSAAAIHWLKSFMRLDPQTTASFTRNELCGRQFACRVALHAKFPEYAELGYKALILGQPIFYYTSTTLEESFYSLGLPKTSFKLVKDAKQFEEFVVNDQENKNFPVMILASVGSGSSEDLQELHAVSRKYNIYMHVEGDDLAMLLTKQPPKFLEVVLSCESFTISPGDWYGLASSSTCTFLKYGIPSSVQVEKEDMLALPLWLTMQYVGQDKLISIISRARVLAREMAKLLSKNTSIITHSSPNSLSVIFRYEPITKPERVFHTDFLDSLNSQVLIDLAETALPLGLDMTVGLRNCMRFRPLFAPELISIETSDVRAFVERLTRAIDCINSTLSCAPAFEEEIQKFKGLQCVHVRNFVGIGAVRYLPNFLRGVNLAPEVSQKVDQVNSRLAKELSEIDVLFSEGTTTEGKICVCLGVETKPIDNNSSINYTNTIINKIEELGLHAIIEEEFGKILTDGIHAAEQHMKVENELAEVQQGIVRSIPVVGSVVNWFSPIEKKVHGKSFDIGSTALRNVVLSPQKTEEKSSSTNSSPSTPIQGTPTVSSEEGENNAKPIPLTLTPSKEEKEEKEKEEKKEEEKDLPKPEELPL